MAYSDAIQNLKDALNGYSEDSAKLESLYKTAVGNADKEYSDTVKQLDRQYYRDRNEAYADNARDERNTYAMLASRGLGFSGEAAQAKLSSNLLLNERLGSLADGKSEAETKLASEYADRKNSLAADYIENQGALNDKRTAVLADIAEMELDREQQNAALKAEKDMHQAELDAKYQSGTISGGNTVINGTSGLEGTTDIISGFTPDVSPKDLAKLMVTNATDGNYIESEDDEYLVNKYMLEIMESYKLDSDYLNELIFMLKAYGYEDIGADEMRVQVISRDARTYYDDRYNESYDRVILSGGHELMAILQAENSARKAQLDYIFGRTSGSAEFIKCCIAAGIPAADAEAYANTAVWEKPSENNRKDNSSGGSGRKFTANMLK